MQATTIELMRDQARAIYRALTGSELPEPEAGSGETEVAPEEVARRFADLESMARSLPAVMDRLLPISFVPPLDALEHEDTLLFELAVPGVDRDDVTIERIGDVLVVFGVRRAAREANGAGYRHSEIPRGPFHRVVQLPYPTDAEPRVEVERGLVRIHLAKK